MSVTVLRVAMTSHRPQFSPPSRCLHGLRCCQVSCCQVSDESGRLPARLKRETGRSIITPSNVMSTISL